MNKNIKTMCGFYINDAHFSAMIFPHIMKRIEDNIITIFETDIDKYINKLLKNTNFKDDIKEKIEKINWKKTDINTLENIKINDNSYIIISGKINYVEKVKQYIEKRIGENKNITIVKYYDIENFKLNINNIIKENEYVVNTAGVMKKEDFFKEKNKKIN